MIARGSKTGVLVFGEFLSYLRANGFLIGVDQYLNLQAVLDKVGADYSIDELRTLLCPLFATNKDQQGQFYRAFDQFFDLTPPALPVAPVPAIRQTVPRWRYALLALVFTSIIVLVFYSLMPGTKDSAIRVLPTPSPSPSVEISPPPPPPTVSPTNNVVVVVSPFPSPSPSLQESPEQTPTPPPPPRTPDDYIKAIRVAMALFLFIIFSVIGLYRYDKRQHRLRQQENKTPPFSYPIETGTPTPKIYNSEEFFRAVRLLGRRQMGEFHRLDIKATVAATIKSLGYLTFRYKPDTRQPEYLILIDRASFQDHQAQLFNELVSAMEYQGLFVVRYFFDGEPHTCCDEKGVECFRLSELQRRYREHRLLIFGDGEGLIDDLTGYLADWTTIFLDWPERALHTPVHPSKWGLRELSLANRFAVIPATVRGLIGLADHFESPLKTDLRHWLKDESLPPPPELEQQEVSDTLRLYLGPEMFDWLCACAVHSELRWDLTLYLGSLPAIGEELITERNLLRLACLPWFRQGAIPAEVRRTLIEELEKDEAKARAVRLAITELLTRTKPPGKSFAASAYQLFLAVQHWLLDRNNPEKKLELLNLVEELPEEELLLDPALASSLELLPAFPFGGQVPRVLRKPFFRHGIPSFGLRASALLLLAAFCLLSSWLASPFIAKALVKEPPPEVIRNDEDKASTPPTSPTSSPTPTATKTDTPETAVSTPVTPVVPKPTVTDSPLPPPPCSAPQIVGCPANIVSGAGQVISLTGLGTGRSVGPPSDPVENGDFLRWSVEPNSVILDIKPQNGTTVTETQLRLDTGKWSPPYTPHRSHRAGLQTGQQFRQIKVTLSWGKCQNVATCTINISTDAPPKETTTPSSTPIESPSSIPTSTRTPASTPTSTPPSSQISITEALAKRADDLDEAINSMEVAKKSLVKSKRITNDEAFRLEKAISKLNDSVSKLRRLMNSSRSVSEQSFANHVGPVSDSLNDLSDAVSSIVKPDGKALFQRHVVSMHDILVAIEASCPKC
jgi:hypothetical protein